MLLLNKITYILFYSICFHSLMIIPFHSLINSQTKPYLPTEIIRNIWISKKIRDNKKSRGTLFLPVLKNFHPIPPPPPHVLDATSNNVIDCEIKRDIFSFKPVKAPGLDGFNPIFFQKYWDIMGHSISSHIKENFLSRKILEDWNSTLICLLPKVEKPKTIHQFWPIGLCNTLYKTITKILVHKIKPHLDDLIHCLQANFIPERKASDNIILLRRSSTPCPSPRAKKVSWL